MTSFFTACSLLPNQQQTPLDKTPHNLIELETLESDAADPVADIEEDELINDVWLRIVSSYQFDEQLENARITAHLNWFKSHPTYLNRVSTRAVRYLYYITEEIEAREIPGEIALLPIVESAFDPFALSHGKASGVWQFIPSTGKYFGLEQDWWQDGRRDIRAATLAALNYLEALNKEFNGDWLLALAAYNSGGGTVRKAIRNNKKIGKPTDFWSLKLPKETQNYVPKLIALSKIVQHPELYGMGITPIANEPYFAVAQTHGQIDLALVAELAETELDEIYNLNPSLNKWATHPDGPHEILIPVSQLEAFEENLKEIPLEARVKWQRYQVKPGDTLNKIALKHRTTTEVIMQSNALKSNIIRPNQELLIPNSLYNQANYSLSDDNRLQQKMAQRRPNSSQRIDYQVVSGDSFWSIAKKFNVNVNQLASWNGLTPRDTLHINKKLVVWIKDSSATSSYTQSNTPQREVIRKINYRVKKGDSLALISQRHNVKLADIQQWNANALNQKYLQPGQLLTLYVDVTQ